MDPLSSGMKVAVYIVTLVFIYFILASIQSEYINAEIANTITTYLQSVLMLIVGYYWGASSKQKALMDSQADDYAKAAATRLEEKRLEAAKQDASDKETARIKIAEEVAEEVIDEATAKSKESTNEKV